MVKINKCIDLRCINHKRRKVVHFRKATFLKDVVGLCSECFNYEATENQKEKEIKRILSKKVMPTKQELE